MNDPSFSVGGLIGFGILSALALFFAKRVHFFDWTSIRWNKSIYLWTPLLFFAIFFGASLFAIKFFVSFFTKLSLSPTFRICLLYSSIPFIQIVLFSIALFLFPKQMRLNFWKDPEKPFSFFNDLKWAFYGWCIAFPVLSFCGNLIGLILYYVFNITELPDQGAVLFVKRCLEDKTSFPFIFVGIAILTPLVEEILFRGALQSFIRKHLGPNSAIWITAICFAFFHYTPEQKLANALIVGSLFPLALLLGFLFEKQRSLFCPILLHSLFNGINLFALLFFGETPCGPI